MQKGKGLLRARAEVRSREGIRHTLGIEKPVVGPRRWLDGEDRRVLRPLLRTCQYNSYCQALGISFWWTGTRREFIDWGLFHVKQNYVETARRYRKLLEQRNAWLRQARTVQTEEDPWLFLITETGHLINELREEYLKDFAHHFSWC